MCRTKKVIRACAEALLTPRIIVCEGKTEVGFVRGLDLIRHENQRPKLARCGVYAADGGVLKLLVVRSLFTSLATTLQC